MKKPTFKNAVEWISLNDEPTDVSVDSIAGYISTLLTAELFGIDPIEVAIAIKEFREGNL